MGKKSDYRKCEVCEAPLILTKDKIYTAIVGSSLFTPGDNYSAIDCEVCGCQNLLKIRHPEKKNENGEEKKK